MSMSEEVASQETKGSSDPSPNAHNATTKSEASHGVSITYRSSERHSNTRSFEIVDKSDEQSEVDVSLSASGSEEKSSVFIEHKVLGIHSEHISKKPAANTRGCLSESVLNSASRRPSLQKKERLPSESPTSPDSGLRSSTADCAARRIGSEPATASSRRYENQFRKASEDRLCRQTMSAKQSAQSTDDRKHGTCAERQRCLPGTTCGDADLSVYSDTDVAPELGTLQKIRDVILFLELFPTTHKITNSDTADADDRNNKMQSDIATTPEEGKGRQIDNLHKTGLDGHSYRDAYSDDRHSQCTASNNEGVVSVLGSFKGKETAAVGGDTPLARPPPSSDTPVSDGSETVHKSVVYGSPYVQRLLQDLKFTLAKGHKTLITFAMAFILLTLVVTVTWGYDYFFPPPTSDRADPAGPLKVDDTNETGHEEGEGLMPMAPFEVLLSDVSILDINDEI